MDNLGRDVALQRLYRYNQTNDMMTLDFWRKRLLFFITIWTIMMIVASFVLLSVTGELNKTYWDGVASIAVRGAINFASYTVLFSILIHFLSQKFPITHRVNPKRLVLTAASIILVALLFAKINITIDLPHNMLIIPPKLPFQVAFVFTFFQAGMTFAILSMWEIAQYNQRLKSSIIQLEKEKLQTQLLALQQQVNPHFLFNSLNVLSELMHEDLEKADEFIAHFSNVYRYVLEINDEAVVTLRQELDFLQSYLFLQQIRFGENLKVSCELSDTAMRAFIPPLSLQLLFENAIKHNTISSECPLKVKLKDTLNRLVVSNNLQIRRTKPNGTGTGLKNLKEKYRLISDQSPEFKIKDGEYIASIPLLNLEI